MEWRDEGLIIGVKKHGETSVILEVMTRAHGRHLGLVKSGRSKRMQPLLQPGNEASVVWRARLDEHLGLFVVEATKLRVAQFLEHAASLHAMNLMAAMLRLLAERDPHQGLYETVLLIADHLDAPKIAPALMVRFELAILAELGFGLDLECCAATGTRDDLIYVSPKSGRAVSRAAGEPYADRLLPLPAFLRGGTIADGPPQADIFDGFKLTEFFLMRDLFGPRGLTLPDARSAYLAAIAKSL
jgi:DNA repair protein RecO (recombination protein O)